MQLFMTLEHPGETTAQVLRLQQGTQVRHETIEAHGHLTQHPIVLLTFRKPRNSVTQWGVLFHTANFFCDFVVQRIDPRASYMLGKCATSEPNPSDLGMVL